MFRWDAKSKKYVRVQDDKKRIKTESGVYISATYKTNRYPPPSLPPGLHIETRERMNFGDFQVLHFLMLFTEKLI